MRFAPSAVLGLVLLAAAAPASLAYVASPSFVSRPFTVHAAPRRRFSRHGLMPPRMMSLRDPVEDDANGGDDGSGGSRRSRLERTKTFGRLLSERMDTFGAAGFYGDDAAGDEDESTALEESSRRSSVSNKDGQVPMHAGIVKTGVQIAVVVWVFRKLKKMIGGSKEKVDDGVVTTKEQDAALHAWTCNKCGATLFVARGKEFRYFNKNYKCYICGNSGRENFTNTREDIIERVGDDFEATDIWDSLTKKDRKRLMKEAGGDEEAAQQLAVDEANEAAGIVASEGDAAEASEAAGESEAAADEISDDGGADAPAAEASSSDEPSREAAPAPAGETSEGGDAPAAAEVSEKSPKEESPAPAPKPKPTPPPAPAPAPAPKPAPVAKTVEKKADKDVDALDMDVWDEFD